MGFLTKLLERDPSKRLGCDPEAEENIKNHVYFKEHFDQNEWNLIEAKEVTPSFIPALRDNKDVSNFDKEFTSDDVEQEDEVNITIENKSLLRINLIFDLILTMEFLLPGHNN